MSLFLLCVLAVFLARVVSTAIVCFFLFLLRFFCDPGGAPGSLTGPIKHKDCDCDTVSLRRQLTVKNRDIPGKFQI